MLNNPEAEVILKDVLIKMAQGLEKVNHKIAAQFKLLELAKKETERLIMRNEKCEIEKRL